MPFPFQKIALKCESALRQVALDAFEERYGAVELGRMIEPKGVIDHAIALILADDPSAEKT